MRAENWLEKMEREFAAQQQASLRDASELQIYTMRERYETTPNTLTQVADWGTGSYHAGERFYVTLNTPDSRNTLGVLEVKNLTNDVPPRIRQVPYDGGIRWLVLNPIIHQPGQPWRTTVFDIAVHAMSMGVIAMEDVRS